MAGIKFSFDVDLSSMGGKLGKALAKNKNKVSKPKPVSIPKPDPGISKLTNAIGRLRRDVSTFQSKADARINQPPVQAPIQAPKRVATRTIIREVIKPIHVGGSNSKLLAALKDLKNEIRVLPHSEHVGGS